MDAIEEQSMSCSKGNAMSMLTSEINDEENGKTNNKDNLITDISADAESLVKKLKAVGNIKNNDIFFLNETFIKFYCKKCC